MIHEEVVIIESYSEKHTNALHFQAVEVFIHINKRVKTRPEIQIPVKDLLEIFIASTQCSPFTSVSDFNRINDYGFFYSFVEFFNHVYKNWFYAFKS